MHWTNRLASAASVASAGSLDEIIKSRIIMQNVFSIFFICLLNLLSLSAQVLNSGITNRYEGSGIIGKYKIEFTLDVIVSPYYERGDHVGEIQQFSGRYYYESQNKNIYLWGTRKITFYQGMSRECS